jgi:hypothetical protein
MWAKRIGKKGITTNVHFAEMLQTNYLQHLTALFSDSGEKFGLKAAKDSPHSKLRELSIMPRYGSRVFPESRSPAKEPATPWSGGQVGPPHVFERCMLELFKNALSRISHEAQM